MLDAPEQTERRIAPQVFVELYVVEVLDCDPAEYRARLFDVGGASAY